MLGDRPASIMSPRESAEAVVRSYLQMYTELNQATIVVQEKARWQTERHAIAVLAGRISDDKLDVSRGFVLLVQDDLHVIGKFETAFEDECIVVEDQFVRICGSLPIDITSPRSMNRLSSMAQGDLVSQLDPAEMSKAAADCIAAFIESKGLAGTAGRDISEILGALQDQYSFADIDPQVVLRTDLLDRVADRIPTEELELVVLPITFDDVSAPRLRYSKYWECRVRIRLCGRRAGIATCVELELAVIGSSIDRDQVDRVSVISIY